MEIILIGILILLTVVELFIKNKNVANGEEERYEDAPMEYVATNQAVVPDYNVTMSVLHSIIDDEINDWVLDIRMSNKIKVPPNEITKKALSTTENVAKGISHSFRNQLLFYYSMESLTFIIHSIVMKKMIVVTQKL